MKLISRCCPRLNWQRDRPAFHLKIEKAVRTNGATSGHAAAGASISTIGGATGAYITKTFLDIHRLSLSQLNFYFRQPVVNSHVLTAQRLAELLPQGAARQQAYEKILANIVTLIREDSTPGNVWAGPLDKDNARPRADAQRRGTTESHPSANG
jgi:hypothetical protein